MALSRWSATVLILACATAPADEPRVRTLRVGGDAAYPPFEWQEPDGKIDGFNIQLMRLIGQADGVEVQFRLGTWPETLAALDSGDIDVVPMFISEARRERYRFSTAFYYQTHALFGRPEQAPIDHVDQLSALDLVVEARSFAEDELEAFDSDTEPRLSANTEDALRLVDEGQSDYALLAASVARELIRAHDWDIERKSAPFWPRAYAFAVRRDREELAQWLQSRLATLMGNGEYLRLYSDWSGRLEVGSEYSPDYVRMVQWLLIVTALAMLVVAAWNYSLRRQVAHRTRLIREELRNRRRAERHARETARRDSTTGLVNGRHFRKRCDELIRDFPGSARAEVMLVRLLDFDSVLRSFGYQVAERMVTGFAAALEDTFSPPVAHLGRGMFAVFGANGRAHRALDELEQAIRRGETLVHPRFVAGSAFYPDDAADTIELMQKAELAMAESQARQCRWTHYVESLQSDPLDIRIIEGFRTEPVEGLGFVLQPQISLVAGRVCACEMLARWHHPELGEISPGRFVPALENAGLVGKLSRCALNQAVADSAALRASGLSGTVSVNISTRDLVDPEFFDRVSALLQAHRIPESDLKLEITETGLLQDRKAVRSNLERLAELGLIISIDDFGTGYSSLDYISRFPISEVKIDRMFVSRMLESDRDRSIVRSTIAMAHEMNITVVGEGVETPEQLEMLKELGCDMAQGWAIGYPVPRDEFIERFRQRPRSGQGPATD